MSIEVNIQPKSKRATALPPQYLFSFSLGLTNLTIRSKSKYHWWWDEQACLLPPSPNKCSAKPHFHFFCSPKLIIHHHLPFSWWLWSHNNWYLASVVQSLQWRGVICAMATTRPRCNAGNKPQSLFPFWHSPILSLSFSMMFSVPEASVFIGLPNIVQFISTMQGAQVPSSNFECG